MALHFEEGKRVKKDDILARLETVDYEADRNRARANLDGAWQRFLELWTGYRPDEIKQAKGALEEARATREQYLAAWGRNLNLPKTAVATRDFEQAESAYRSADRRVVRLDAAYSLMLDGPRPEKIIAAWADIEQAAADLTKAQWRLDNCIIKAPRSGTIL